MKKEQNITESIKTFEDAMKAIGRPDVPDFSNLPEGLREYFEAQYKMTVIAEALNEGWKANWKDDSQGEHYPWFEVSSSGLVFLGTYCRYPAAFSGYASRLCFSSSALAEYAGKQFIDIWRAIIAK